MDHQLIQQARWWRIGFWMYFYYLQALFPTPASSIYWLPGQRSRSRGFVEGIYYFKDTKWHQKFKINVRVLICLRIACMYLILCLCVCGKLRRVNSFSFIFQIKRMSEKKHTCSYRRQLCGAQKKISELSENVAAKEDKWSQVSPCTYILGTLLMSSSRLSFSFQDSNLTKFIYLASWPSLFPL